MLVTESPVGLEGDTCWMVLEGETFSLELGTLKQNHVLDLVEIDRVTSRAQKRQEFVLDFPLDLVAEIWPSAHLDPSNARTLLCQKLVFVDDVVKKERIHPDVLVELCIEHRTAVELVFLCRG